MIIFWKRHYTLKYFILLREKYHYIIDLSCIYDGNFIAKYSQKLINCMDAISHKKFIEIINKF
jgi:hypothetical protein